MRPARVAVVATGLAAGAVLAAAAPAVAVQTGTFGLQASGARTTLLHPPGDGAVHDTVVLYNRTARPQTIALDVVSERRNGDGSYTAGPADRGLAADVRIERRSVRLAPHGRTTVGVTIDRPTHSPTASYAAVTAVAVTAGGADGLAVREQLAVLVGVTADGRSPSDGGGSGRSIAVLLAALAALTVLTALGVLAARRLSGRPRGKVRLSS